MRPLLIAAFFVPAITFAQTPVAKHKDGSLWLVYAETTRVSEPLENGDRTVSALVEKRDGEGRSVGRARQYTTGCYIHAEGKTSWGDGNDADEWTWSGPLILDMIATRSCQYAWIRVEPAAGIAVTQSWPLNIRPAF